jgi:two-component system phosphate regulon sensor histidine kinase PhoR
LTVHPLLAEQAVLNLVDNAIKYSGEGTQVIITASDHEETAGAFITVEDQGPGIPEADLERIFERFYTVDKARSRQVGGTGLGLSIVKHIALVHGGNVSVKSKVGRGSLFRIDFSG